MGRMQGTVNLSKNVTIKSLPSLDLKIKEGDPQRLLCTFLGTVTGTEVKPTQFGESVRFIGQFEAIDLETGETARGSSLFLPGHSETVVADAFASAEGRPIQFALNVGIKYRKKGTEDGMEYTVHEIGGITEHDPLASLKAQFGVESKRSAPVLEAPAEAPALPAPSEVGEVTEVVVAGGSVEVIGAASEQPAEPAKTSDKKGSKKGK